MEIDEELELEENLLDSFKKSNFETYSEILKFSEIEEKFGDKNENRYDKFHRYFKAINEHKEKEVYVISHNIFVEYLSYIYNNQKLKELLIMPDSRIQGVNLEINKEKYKMVLELKDLNSKLTIPNKLKFVEEKIFNISYQLIRAVIEHLGYTYRHFLTPINADVNLLNNRNDLNDHNLIVKALVLLPQLKSRQSKNEEDVRIDPNLYIENMSKVIAPSIIKNV